MSSLRELAFNIGNLVRGGILSDDEKISYRQRKFIIRYTRALLIRQDLNKGKSINPDIVQHLPCVPLINVDRSTCRDLPVDCYIARTELKLPKTVELNQKNAIMYVSTIDNSLSFPEISLARSKWSSFNKYTGKLKRFWQDDGYYFINNDTVISQIRTGGIYENPEEAANFIDDEGLPCFTDDSPYPMSETMIRTMNEMMMKSEYAIALVSKTDTTNDGNGEVEQVQQQR